MDTIRLFTGGFPLTLDRLSFMMQCYEKAISQLSQVTGSGYRIVSGVELDDPDTPATVTDGVIILDDGEIMEFKGGPYGSQVFIVNADYNVPYNEDIAPADGALDEKPADRIRYAQCGNTLRDLSPGGFVESIDVGISFAFTALRRVRSLLDMTPTVGEIKMFYGPEIPDGWSLCDGTNGTPDFTDRFPIGVGENALGSAGGAKEVSLSMAQMPNHNHSGNITIPDHSHSLQGKTAITYDGETGDGNRLSTTDNIGNSTVTATSNGGGGTFAYNTNYKGNGDPHENRPPFRAVQFIMFTGY